MGIFEEAVLIVRRVLRDDRVPGLTTTVDRRGQTNLHRLE